MSYFTSHFVVKIIVLHYTALHREAANLLRAQQDEEYREAEENDRRERLRREQEAEEALRREHEAQQEEELR